MSKYDNLYTYLKSQPSTTNLITLTFEYIEQYLEISLPPSAYSYLAWWNNTKSGGRHIQSRAWMAAGWLVHSIDLISQEVSFHRE